VVVPLGNVSFFFAFTAGLLSFLSPCVFPLLPVYVANLTGGSFKDNRIDVSRKLLIVRSLGFILGFSLIFTAMGATASVIGGILSSYRTIIEKIGGLLIIVFGMQTAGILKLRLLMYESHWNIDTQKKNILSSMLLGISFGIGWTPCVSLALSSILLLAGSAGTVYRGMFLLSVYSLGLGVPFLIITFLITYSIIIFKKINKFLGILSIVNGWILIVMGLLLYTGQLQKISAWLAGFTY
jgi:cytochrome c-type biogenesis protein